MSKVIGIDPDCVKSGLAVYENGNLTGLLNLTLAEYAGILPALKDDAAVIAIEDANLIGGMYRYNPKDSRALAAKKAQHVGAIKRQCSAMIELAEAAGITVKTYKPEQGNWAGVSKTVKTAAGKKMMLAATGWDKQSNPETRSAAYFGYKHLKAMR